MKNIPNTTNIHFIGADADAVICDVSSGSDHLRFISGMVGSKNAIILSNDGNSFQDESAPVEMGVGKNMAKSIRFWGLAAKIIEYKNEKGKKSTSLIPTEFGDFIFDEKIGHDPYLEKSDTTWLIHWNLFAPPTMIPVWWILMNEFDVVRSTSEDMLEFAQTKISEITSWNQPNPKSIKKDVDVFIHTYTTGRNKKTPMEDYLDSPFRSMNIIKRSSVDNSLHFTLGKKLGMSADTAAYICFDFLEKRGIGSKTFAVNTLATESGGPGKVLKLDEGNILSLLHESATMHSDLFRIHEVNGMAHLSFQNISLCKKKLQESIYKKSPEVLERRVSA